MSRRKRKALNTWQIIIILFGFLVFIIIYPYIGNIQKDLPSVIIFLLICVVLLSCIAFFVVFISKQTEKNKAKALEISDIDKMSGIEFEKYVGKILLNKGYKINFTNIVNDYGADILASKDKIRYAIQLKRYSKPVGRSAISDAVAAILYYKCDKAMVITNNYFTKSAKELAKLNNCVLVNRDQLATWIVNFKI